MTRQPSNYFKAYTVVNDGVMSEQVCRACKGTGEDPHTPDADCIECWGEGTLELSQAA
jgi:DnaJ-class molecular chaperone